MHFKGILRWIFKGIQYLLNYSKKFCECFRSVNIPENVLENFLEIFRRIHASSWKTHLVLKWIKNYKQSHRWHGLLMIHILFPRASLLMVEDLSHWYCAQSIPCSTHRSRKAIMSAFRQEFLGWTGALQPPPLPPTVPNMSFSQTMRWRRLIEKWWGNRCLHVSPLLGLGQFRRRRREKICPHIYVTPDSLPASQPEPKCQLDQVRKVPRVFLPPGYTGFNYGVVSLPAWRHRGSVLSVSEGAITAKHYPQLSNDLCVYAVFADCTAIILRKSKILGVFLLKWTFEEHTILGLAR